jgi:hypothetical protein
MGGNREVGSCRQAGRNGQMDTDKGVCLAVPTVAFRHRVYISMVISYPLPQVRVPQDRHAEHC